MTSGAVEEDDKNRSVVTEHIHHQPSPPSFQGVSNYPPPPPQQPPSTGFPQPSQPHVSAYVVNGERVETDYHRLPCCGLGIGWLLFILGFFFGAIPWYIGFFLFLFSKNPREKPGYMACAIGAIVATIFIVVGATRGSGVW